MYGISTDIQQKNQPHVCKYTIHEPMGCGTIHNGVGTIDFCWVLGIQVIWIPTTMSPQNHEK